MRLRPMILLLVLAVATWSAASFVGAAEEEAATTPAEPEVVATEAETPEGDATEAEPAEPMVADPFLEESPITITPVHTVYCVCQVGVNCCGDTELDEGCGNRRECVCNAQNDCVLQHVHGKGR